MAQATTIVLRLNNENGTTELFLYEQLLHVQRDNVNFAHYLSNDKKFEVLIPEPVVDDSSLEDVLKHHGWRYLGKKGVETAWEKPDEFICAFTDDGHWIISQQWTLDASISAGNGPTELEEELTHLETH